MGPAAVIAMMDAVLKGDKAGVESIAAEISWANEPVKPIFRDPEVFAQYNIQVEKTRINAAGYCNSGPIRPPYDDLPEQSRAPSDECGQRGAQLHKKFSDEAAARKI